MKDSKEILDDIRKHTWAENGVVVESSKSAIFVIFKNLEASLSISHPPNDMLVRPMPSIFFFHVNIIIVKELQEFYPKNASLYGLNINRSVIKVDLKPTIQLLKLNSVCINDGGVLSFFYI